MTTTIVRDSIVGDAWIRQAASQCPVQRKLGADGQPTGDILTGPVRLSFVHLDKPAPKDKPEDSDNYNAVLMFPPGVDFSIFYQEYYAACGREFPQHWDAASQQFSGLHSPFHNQKEKLKYSGYTPDCVYITSGSQFKPPVVDVRGNPIIDPNKFYAGVWAICAVKPYGYGKNPKPGKPTKKGVNFGLQAVMLIGDDTPLAGGGADAKEMFQGVNVTAAVTRPDLAAMPQGFAPAPAAGIPGYTMPGGGVGPLPAQGYAPPAGYAAPSPQGGYAQPATLSPAEQELAELRAMGLA